MSPVWDRRKDVQRALSGNGVQEAERHCKGDTDTDAELAADTAKLLEGILHEFSETNRLESSALYVTVGAAFREAVRSQRQRVSLVPVPRG